MIQLVLSLGIYFSAFAATFALGNMFPNLQSLGYVLPIFGCLLPSCLGLCLLPVLAR